MDFIILLQNFIRFVLGLLLAMLPLYNVIAQEVPKGEKKLRIKYIQNINGVETVKDTTITITEMATSLQSFSRLKVDTAALRRLTRVTAVVGDTTRFRALTGRKFSAYRLSEKLTEAEREAFVKQLNTQQKDSLLKVWLKSGKIKALTADSLYGRTYERVAGSAEFRAHTLRAASPKGVYRIQADTLKAVRFVHRDSSIVHLRPSRAERIYFLKNGSHVFADSLVIKADGKTTYKIISGDSTGNRRIFKLGEDGEEQLLHELTLQPGAPAVIFIRRVIVEDMTPEDVTALQKTGTPVETKRKEELELEQIEYYPNPNDGKFNIRFKPENKGTTVVRVLDSKGQEVFVDTIEKLNGEYSRQIDLTPFGKGLYFLQIAQGKRYHTKKILVR